MLTEMDKICGYTIRCEVQGLTEYNVAVILIGAARGGSG